MMKKYLRHLVAACAVLTCAPAFALQLGSMVFKSCEIGSGNYLSKAECAYLEVPENYAAPNARKIKLHIALIAANARKPKLEPVVFLAGGPGQSASDSYGQVAAGFREILKTRHLLLIDQRGTGLSHALKCQLPDDIDSQVAPDSGLAQKLAQDCLAKLDADPRFYTTTVATQDLERLRVAVNAPQLNLVGFSYGTRVAQQFARHYPKSVRSLILDGIAPNPLILGSEHAKNLDDALSQQFARCVADKACHARFGDPAQTLATLKQTLRAQPSEIMIADPLTAKMRSVKLGIGALQGMARFYAYASEMAALVPLLMDEAKQGRPQAMLAQSEIAGKNLEEMMSNGMQLSVICSEDAEFLKTDPLDAERLLGNDIGDALQAQCQVWPKGERPKDFFNALKSDVPTLLISGELDPVTPPRYGETVLQGLRNATHVIAPAQGHINLMRGCIPKLAGEFMETLKPKELETKCVKEILPAPFFLEFTGPSP
jgi:pimeloyl-ACP methyl ester carboxylesterase